VTRPRKSSACWAESTPARRPPTFFLAPSGMNAIYAAFRAINTLQAPRGRTAWLQLGWLYLDTIALLKKFTSRSRPGLPAPWRCHRSGRIGAHVRRARIPHRRRRHRGPDQSLVQTPDVAAVAGPCRRHGARLVLDPAISSPFNVDLLPHADLVAQSLTKYTAHEGDVIAGALVVNPAGPEAAALRELIAGCLEPVHPRDVARLAMQIGTAGKVVARINASTIRVAAFLEAHSAVRQVWWALQPATRANYLQVARAPDAVGCMISFTLHAEMENFYDRVRLPKGPSFGMQTTLLSPFIYLATTISWFPPPGAPNSPPTGSIPACSGCASAPSRWTTSSLAWRKRWRNPAVPFPPRLQSKANPAWRKRL